MEVIVGLIGIIGILVLLLLYTSMSYGYLVYKFWYLFLLPVFPQMPHIAFWQAVGLMMFISLFKNKTDDGIKDDYRKDKYQRMLTELLTPWLSLIVGYIVYCWIK